MNVCIDVGNTTVAIGFYANDVLQSRLIQYMDINRTEDEYVVLLKNTISSLEINKKDVNRIIYSSVVPSVNKLFLGAIKKVFNISPLLINPGIKTGLSIKVDNPLEIGNDLIADLVGAKEKYSYPTIIVDLGTASKILILDKNGVFCSCAIMPGLALSATSLTNKTALLPEVSLEAPKTVLAKNTVDAMNVGIVLGHAYMINGLVKRYEEELGYKCKHILTGGNAIYLNEVVDESFIYDVNLTLDGLNLLIRKNEVK